MRGRRFIAIASLAAAVAGSTLLFQGGYIHLKALAGQWLIERAWRQSLEDGESNRPWPWMDTWPVAALAVPALGIEQVVLAGDSGQSLAFGPGHRTGSALPGQPGVMLISGHRDTHFLFLARLAPGGILQLTDRDNRTFRYRISSTRVVAEQTQLGMEGTGHLLVLATCWPPGMSLAEADRRFLVIAEPVNPNQSTLASNSQ